MDTRQKRLVIVSPVAPFCLSSPLPISPLPSLPLSSHPLHSTLSPSFFCLLGTTDWVVPVLCRNCPPTAAPITEGLETFMLALGPTLWADCVSSSPLRPQHRWTWQDWLREGGGDGDLGHWPAVGFGDSELGFRALTLQEPSLEVTLCDSLPHTHQHSEGSLFPSQVARGRCAAGDREGAGTCPVTGPVPGASAEPRCAVCLAVYMHSCVPELACASLRVPTRTHVSLSGDDVPACVCSQTEGLAGKLESPPPRPQPLLPGALVEENTESPDPEIWDGGFCQIPPPFPFLDTNSLWNKGSWGFGLFIQSTLSNLWSI